MQNRRELLVNLVELTITSNVSSVIQFKVGGSTQSFTGTSASIKVDQGKTVEWRVSADKYISKSGSEVMRNDKDVSVSLELDTVTFTINTNVSASITINGDTSTGVMSKSVSVVPGSTVEWSCSASGYFSQSGSENALTEDKSVSVSLVSGVTSTCTARYIWCTDGSFVAPECYQSSGKTAYGYALSNTKVARLTKSSDTMVWAPENTAFSFFNATGAQSLTDGVANSNKIKSMYGFDSTNCPAVHYSCNQVNANKFSYMPAKEEVVTLYNSIMSGNMKDDLITAGLYESCNYRDKSSDSWNVIWSSTEHSKTTNKVWFISHIISQPINYKFVDYYVIPFFKF